MRVGSVLPAQAGNLGLCCPIINETRLSKSVVQCPLRHSLTIALGGRIGVAFGHDHLLQQKQSVSEERWQGGNQPAEWMTQVTLEKNLTWERQDPPRLCGISAGSHGCPFMLMGTCSGFACSYWPLVPTVLLAAAWASLLCLATG